MYVTHQIHVGQWSPTDRLFWSGKSYIIRTKKRRRTWESKPNQWSYTLSTAFIWTCKRNWTSFVCCLVFKASCTSVRMSICKMMVNERFHPIKWYWRGILWVLIWPCHPGHRVRLLCRRAGELWKSSNQRTVRILLIRQIMPQWGDLLPKFALPA